MGIKKYHIGFKQEPVDKLHTTCKVDYFDVIKPIYKVFNACLFQSG